MTTRKSTATVASVRTCQLDSLESRRMLAIDLIVPSVDLLDTTVVPALVAPGGDVELTLFMANEGTTDHVGSTQMDVVFTLDTIIGNGDDRLMDRGLGRFTVSNVSTTAGHGPNSSLARLPAGTPAGDYYVAIIVDPLGQVAESDEADNVTISATPIVRSVTSTWPAGPILGTAGNDVIVVHENEDEIFVTLNGETRVWEEPVNHIWFIDAGTGNDKIFPDNSGISIHLAVTGAGGNDTIVGGSASDELSGANGKDKVFGGGGFDYLLGGAQNDYLNGETGNDTMSGAGGNDRLADDFGKNYFLGGAGNDVLLARDFASDNFSDPDTVSGGSGTDRAQLDVGTFADGSSSIEELLA